MPVSCVHAWLIGRLPDRMPIPPRMLCQVGFAAALMSAAVLAVPGGQSYSLVAKVAAGALIGYAAGRSRGRPARPARQGSRRARRWLRLGARLMQATAFLAADPATLAALSADLPAETITVVDFDGTLLLRNSTQLYLQTLRPRLARPPRPRPARARPALELLPGRDKPSSTATGCASCCSPCCCPGRPCSGAAPAHARPPPTPTRPARSALASRPAGTVIVATYGVRFIVAPLLPPWRRAWPLQVSASFLAGFRLRRLGKAATLQPTLGPETLRRSLLSPTARTIATSSGYAGTPICCPPPSRPPASGYLPLQYMHHCKRRGENVILRTILFYDLLCLLARLRPRQRHKLLCALGLLLFQLAFWTVYETRQLGE